MKKFIFLLFIMVATGTVTMAQDSTSTKAKHPKARQDAAQQGTTKQGKKQKPNDLNLTKDQQTKIKATNKKYKFESQKVKKDSSLTDSQKKAKLKDLKKEKKKETDTVLTAEQKNKLKQEHKQSKKNSPENSKPSPKSSGTAKR